MTKSTTPISAIQKHEVFIKEVKEYIRECLKNKVNPHDILKSFSMLIDDTVNEALKEATAKQDSDKNE